MQPGNHRGRNDPFRRQTQNWGTLLQNGLKKLKSIQYRHCDFVCRLTALWQWEDHSSWRLSYLWVTKIPYSCFHMNKSSLPGKLRGETRIFGRKGKDKAQAKTCLWSNEWEKEYSWTISKTTEMIIRTGKAFLHPYWMLSQKSNIFCEGESHLARQVKFTLCWRNGCTQMASVLESQALHLAVLY